MDSALDLDIVERKLNIDLELNDKYPSVQCIVGGGSKLSEGSNQVCVN